MLLSEPPKTDYDFEFPFMGFSVRVSIGFWIMGFLLGYDSASAWAGALDLNRGVVLMIWIFVLFASILIHELGHALAFRRYGIHSSIVLYHMGGLAIPRGSFRGGSGNLTSNEHIAVSFAGPLFQLILAGIVIALLKITGYAIPVVGWIEGLEGGRRFESPGMAIFVHHLLFVNIYWAVLNLIPIWPLDGGQIAREVVRRFGGTVYHSSVLSIVCCIGAAIYLLKTESHSLFTFVLLASLAFTNYQVINSNFGRRW